MTQQTSQDVIFEREAGGEDCELSVVREGAPDNSKAICDPEKPPVYPSNEVLPEDIRKSLPSHIQTLYREAYNHAWANHTMPVRRGFASRHDEAASKAGWSAVKRRYIQNGTTWIRRI